MIEIDGSQGEGGGQILRSALALSLLTGRAFAIARIRAKRKKPGLMRQHLVAVDAAVRVGNAEVRGAALGSGELVFQPGAVHAGEYHFCIGTAGSATLVLQTILPPLLRASGESRIVIEGGTHNPMAPPFDFLDRTFAPLLNRIGPRMTPRLIQPGFFPAGGGAIAAEITPPRQWRRLELTERAAPRGRRARALVAKLPTEIGRRELEVVRERLGWSPAELAVEEIRDSRGPGNVLLLELSYENVTETITAFGERGVRAEAVAEAAVAEARAYLAGDAPVGEHLADQLLLPLALGAGGTYRAAAISSHARTNLTIIQMFLGIEAEIAEERGAFRIDIQT